jgi:hypothetical protein
MMRVFFFNETPNWYFMVNVQRSSAPAFFASSGLSYCATPCGLPSHSVAARGASCPPRVRFLPNVFGIPSSHTPVIAKNQNGVKVGGCAPNYLSTFCAVASRLTPTLRVWSPRLPLLRAIPRTILLISLACAFARTGTNSASVRLLEFSPASQKVAFVGAILLGWPAVNGIEWAIALLAFQRDRVVDHTETVSKPNYSVEEKYCANVYLPLTIEPTPQMKEQELL